MNLLVTLLALAIPMGGPITSATASAERIGDQMRVEFVVEVDVSATVVVAHLVVGGDEAQQSVSLGPRGGATFGGFVMLPIRDAIVVFEVLNTNGGELSEASTPGELGVDFAALGASPAPSSVEDLTPDSTPARDPMWLWLWLALAAGAAALSALGFWARAGGPDTSESTEADPSEPDDLGIVTS